ncbi:MAG: efflux RND transporter periplasmic adaptor subunit [Planctomycetia bacterium]
MNIVRSILGWIVPLVILGCGIAAFMLMGSQPPPARKTGDSLAAAVVKTVEATPEVSGLTIEADGVVVPLREVTLAAEVAGRVQTKSAACNEGQFVKAGTLLFEIDSRDYALDVERLDREFRQAGLAIEELDEELAQNAATIDLARRQVELARREVARLDTLKAGRIVTESEHDRALRDELTATNSLTAAEGQKRVLSKRRNRLLEAQSLASTMLDKAKLDLARTRIVSPVDGIVVEDKVEQDSFVAKGTALVTIEDTRAAEVRTSLQMDEVAMVWGSRRRGDSASRVAHEELDMPAAVVFTVGDSAYEWKGTLSRQEGRGLDEKTRTLPCRVLVAHPEEVTALDRYGAAMPQLPPGAPQSLLRGMFVQVRVQVDTPGDLVSIPEEAQRPSGELWVMREGRLVILKPRAVQVTRGRVVFDSASSGLVAGDRVVTTQLSAPRDGMEIVEPNAAAATPTRTADTAADTAAEPNAL